MTPADLAAVAEKVAPAVGTVIAGWAGQHFLKARKDFSTNLAHAITFAVGFGFYALGHHDIADPTQWFVLGCAWAGSLGVATGSVLAGAKVAAGTDTKP